MAKIIILGCGGFTGSHLLDLLLADPDIFVDGWDVEDRKIAHHLSNRNLRLHRSALGERGSMEELERTIDDASAVVNLAAICNPSQYNMRPLDVIKGNFLDLYPIVELCAERRVQLIHFSSSEVYGRTIASYLPGSPYDNPDLYEQDEETTPLIMGPIRNQRWTYACAKQMLERFIYAHHKENGLPFTIVRPLNFLGPRMDYIPGRDGEGVPRVLACFMGALLDGKPMQLVDGGKARRSIACVKEAVEAVRLMLKMPDRSMGQVFNIGNRDNEVTMAELADLMRRTYAKITGDPAYDEHPIEVVTGEEFYGEGYEDCDRRMPKLDKARELLGWVPRRPLPEILEETMAYYYTTYSTAARATLP